MAAPPFGVPALQPPTPGTGPFGVPRPATLAPAATAPTPPDFTAQARPVGATAAPSGLPDFTGQAQLAPADFGAEAAPAPVLGPDESPGYGMLSANRSYRQSQAALRTARAHREQLQTAYGEAQRNMLKLQQQMLETYGPERYAEIVAGRRNETTYYRDPLTREWSMAVFHAEQAQQRIADNEERVNHAVRQLVGEDVPYTEAGWLNVFNRIVSSGGDVVAGAARGIGLAGEYLFQGHPEGTSFADYLKTNPGIETNFLTQFADWLGEFSNTTFAPDPARQAEVASQVATVFGSMLPFVGGTMVGGAIGRGVGIGRTAGATVAAGAFGSALQGAAQWEDALAHNADAYTRFKAFLAGSAIGTTEMVPIHILFGTLNRISGGAVMRAITAGALEAGAEGVQEFSQNVLTDMTAQQLYDASRVIDWDQAAQSGTYAALVAAIFGAGIGLTSRPEGTEQPAPTALPGVAPGAAAGAPAPPPPPPGVPEGALPAETILPPEPGEEPVPGAPAAPAAPVPPMPQAPAAANTNRPPTPMETAIEQAIAGLQAAVQQNRPLESVPEVKQTPRVATALSFDVKNSTGVGEGMDPTRFAEIMEGAFERFSAIIEDAGGRVVSFGGDGGLAVFDDPSTGSPQNAVDTAHALQRAAAEISAEIKDRYGVDFGMRVGVNTGQMSVSGEGSGKVLGKGNVMGDTVNAAARLGKLGDTGQVIVSRETSRLLGPRYEAVDLGPVAVKGRQAAVEAAVAHPIEGPSQALEPFGRAMDARLRDRMANRGLTDTEIMDFGVAVAMRGLDPTALTEEEVDQLLSFGIYESFETPEIKAENDRVVSEIVRRQLARWAKPDAGTTTTDEVRNAQPVAGDRGARGAVREEGKGPGKEGGVPAGRAAGAADGKVAGEALASAAPLDVTDDGHGPTVKQAEAAEATERRKTRRKVSIGLNTQPASWLGKIGVHVLTDDQFEALLDYAAGQTAVDIVDIQYGEGGWTNADGTYEGEPSATITYELTGDRFKLGPNIGTSADAFPSLAGLVAGQFSVLTVQEATQEGSSHQRLAIMVSDDATVTPQRLFEIAHGVNPDLFGGFATVQSESYKGISIVVPNEKIVALDQMIDQLAEAYDKETVPVELFTEPVVADFIEGTASGEGYVPRIVSTATSSPDRFAAYFQSEAGYVLEGVGQREEGEKFRPKLKGRDPQTRTAAFQQWFKGSAIVDRGGLPLRVYHSHSSGVPFEAFDTTRGDFGAHFGTAKAAQDRYGYKKFEDPDNSGGSVGAYYLAIKNPIRLPDVGDWRPERIVNELGAMFGKDERGYRQPLFPRKEIAELEQEVGRPDDDADSAVQEDSMADYDDVRRDLRAEAYKAIREYLEDNGYDGVVYKNNVEGREVFPKPYGSISVEGDSWIAFRPTQIKSATGNAGFFNDLNPSVLAASMAALPFYSAVKQFFLDAKQQRATGADWLAMIHNAIGKVSGLKQEEIDFLGLEDFLKGTAGSAQPSLPGVAHVTDAKRLVEKDEIITYINDHELIIEEVDSSGGSAVDFSFGSWETDEPDPDYLRSNASERFDREPDEVIDKYFSGHGYESAHVYTVVNAEGNEEEISDFDEIRARYYQEEEGPDLLGTKKEKGWNLPDDLQASIIDWLTEQEEESYNEDSDSPQSMSVTATVNGERRSYTAEYSYGELQIYSSDSGNYLKIDITNWPRGADNPQIEQMIREAEGFGGEGDTQYSEYNLGGEYEDYHELKMIAPPILEKEDQYAGWRVEEGMSLGGLPAFYVFDEKGQRVEGDPAATRAGAEARLSWLVHQRRSRSDFKSAHWEERNVLAHVRFDVREIEVPDFAGTAIEVVYREEPPQLPGVSLRWYPWKVERNGGVINAFASEAEARKAAANVSTVGVQRQRVLFIEEIQSDWHQHGRESGYQHTLTAEEINAKAAAKKALDDAFAAHDVIYARYRKSHEALAERDRDLRNSERLRGTDNDRYKTYEELLRTDPEYQRLDVEVKVADNAYNASVNAKVAASQAYEKYDTDNQVPNAPLKTTWPDMVLKRMIRWAADNGFDQMAWTSGAAQNERWSLSQQIGALSWGEKNLPVDASSLTPEREKQAFRIVGIYAPTGNPLGRGSFIGALFVDRDGRVFDHSIGRSEEQKDTPLSDWVGKETAVKIMADAAGDIRGKNLELGGRGMIGFYDEILPAAANKIVKKFHTKVERLGNVSWAMQDGPGTIWLMHITPELKEVATNKGFSLFQEAPPATSSGYVAGRVLKATPEQRALLENNMRSIIGRIGAPNIDIIMQPQIYADSTAVDRTVMTPVIETLGGVYTQREGTQGKHILPGEHIIQIALEDPSYDPITVTYHEAYHSVETALLYDQELKILLADMANPDSKIVQMAAMEWSEILRRKGKVTGEIGGGVTPQWVRKSFPGYEARAVAFQHYARHKELGIDVTSGLHIAIRRAWDRILRMIRMVRRMLQRYGFYRVEDLFEDIRTGYYRRNRQPIGGTHHVKELDAAAGNAGMGSAMPDGGFDFSEAKGTGPGPMQPNGQAYRQGMMGGALGFSMPIDHAIRIPFQAVAEIGGRVVGKKGLGHIDQQGRLAAGVHVSKWMRHLIRDAKFGDNHPLRWLNPTLHIVRQGIVDRYGLPDEYIKRDYEMGLDKRRIERQIPELLRILDAAHVGATEAKVLQAILTGERIPDAQWKLISEPIRNAIDQLGQEAVNLGLLSAESFDRNRGAYLHRVYLKHERDQGGLTRLINRINGNSRKKIIGNEFKGRGLFKEVDANKIPGMGWKKGDKIRMVDEMQPTTATIAGSIPKVKQRHYLPASVATPAGQIDRGVWEIRGARGGNLILWRDYTKAERTSMGEILDARYTITKTFMLLAHDLANGRFYRDIANNPDWASKDEPLEEWREAANYRRVWGDESVIWVRVPDTVIEKSNTKRWGALAGRWVRAEIWRDINEVDLMQRGNLWRDLMRQFKLNHTARSPVTHMNNIMSNVMLLDMAGVGLGDLARAMRSWHKGDQTFKDAEDAGAFGVDMISAEMRNEVLGPLLDEIEAAMTGGVGTLQARAGLMGKLIDTIWDKAKAVDRKMLDAYRMEDEIFRLAIYIRRIAQGVSKDQAAIEARDQFINYDIRAPWVNIARNTMLPFIAYTYRSVPLLAKTMATRPWKLAKYYIIAEALNALGYAINPGDEDEERRSLREEEAGFTWVGTPRMIRLPWGDGFGNPVFLDVRRWIPAGDVFDFGRSPIGIIPAPLIFGGPLLLAMELLLNKSAFTQEEIFDPYETTRQRVGTAVGYLYRSWVPSAAWIPGSWYWNRIGNAITGATEWDGRPYTMANALLSSIGIKMKAQDVETGFASWGFEFRAREEALRSQAYDLARQRARGLVSESAFNAGMERITRRLEQLGQAAQYRFQGQPGMQ